MATHRQWNCAKSAADIAKALTGNYIVELARLHVSGTSQVPDTALLFACQTPVRRLARDRSDYLKNICSPAKFPAMAVPVCGTLPNLVEAIVMFFAFSTMVMTGRFSRVH